VLDEADLVLSYGYDEDMENISRSLPKTVQTIMMSATLSAELDTLKGIFCRNPTLLDLKEEFGAEDEKLTQFYVKCGEDDKWLISYLIFKLQLVKGPCLIFVADIDRSYRLKLFFEQFSIRSCVLNSELPINTRIKIIEEFNQVCQLPWTWKMMDANGWIGYLRYHHRVRREERGVWRRRGRGRRGQKGGQKGQGWGRGCRAAEEEAEATQEGRRIWRISRYAGEI
jgi:hypothetical protein